jgi:bifunctional non-homologous end joining protein LigD
MREHPALLDVFDTLAAAQNDIRALPLLERKQFLRDSFRTTQFIYVVGIASAGAWVFEQVELHDFENMWRSDSIRLIRGPVTRLDQGQVSGL